MTTTEPSTWPTGPVNPLPRENTPRLDVNDAELVDETEPDEASAEPLTLVSG